MEKEKLYHIALDDYEHGVVIRSLNDVVEFFFFHICPPLSLIVL